MLLPLEDLGFGKICFLDTPASVKEQINPVASFKPSGLTEHQFFTTVIKKTLKLVQISHSAKTIVWVFKQEPNSEQC